MPASNAMEMDSRRDAPPGLYAATFGLAMISRLVAGPFMRSSASMFRPMTSPTLALLLMTLPTAAADCPGNADALGVSRVLEIDPAKTAPVGRKQFPMTLPLAKKEVVLTFDDGPV